jgi:NADPH:quinone reductase
MRTIHISEIGDSTVLQVQELPEPYPKAGEVSIRVSYAGVNYAEVMVRRGDVPSQLPLVPGLEVAGYIHAVGIGVEHLTVGEPVCAFTGTGGYAEIAIARAALVFSFKGLEDKVDLQTAAAFPVIVPTAYALLQETARLRQGESILIHAAAGGVGSIAGQIARYLGASHVYGTVGSSEKVDYALRLGYDEVFLRDEFVDIFSARNGSNEIMPAQGVDVVLDSIGGKVTRESLEILRPMGRLVVFGNAAGSNRVSFSNFDLWSQNKSVLGFSISKLSHAAPDRVASIARQALELVAQQHIQIDVTQILPLSQASEAHKLLESRHTTGKLLLQVA